MRLLLQRVTHAKLWIEGQLHAQIGAGLVLLVCAEGGDTPQDIPVAIHKLLNLRLFASEGPSAKPMDRTVQEIDGSVLVVSQFTLAARVSKGRRPSFDRAMPPAPAKILYHTFVQSLESQPVKVQSGVFGANMQVELINDGPVTIGFCVRDGRVIDEGERG